MAARPRTPPLHATARDGQDQGEGGVHAEEREAVAELILDTVFNAMGMV